MFVKGFYLRADMLQRNKFAHIREGISLVCKSCIATSFGTNVVRYNEKIVREKKRKTGWKIRSLREHRVTEKNCELYAAYIYSNVYNVHHNQSERSKPEGWMARRGSRPQHDNCCHCRERSTGLGESKLFTPVSISRPTPRVPSGIIKFKTDFFSYFSLRLKLRALRPY